MTPLCDAGLLQLRLLLVVTAAVLISNSATPRQGKNMSTWSQYPDAMCAVCISQEDPRISMKLTTLLHCFKVQRKHLQCAISNQLSDNFLAPTGTISGLQTPCGLIHLSNESEASFSRRQWTIIVHSQLYLNLTFLELVLPMPYGRCDLSQGSEHLLIRPEINSLNLTMKDAVFLCGEHSPFSLVWTDSRALLVYRRGTSVTQVGHFRVQYQVCDQRIRIPKVHIIRQASVFQAAGKTSLQFSKLRFFESGPKHVMYTVHLLGNRLKLLDVMFIVVDTGKEHFSVDAFDGPGPAELHRHPSEHQALVTEGIHFSTFQAYLQITCEKYHCGGIFMKYEWTSTPLYRYKVMLSEDFIITFSDFAGICSQGNRWYCMFSIATHIGENVEISLQTVHFHGPDYLGGFSEPYNCLLAGVTIADEYRTTFMKNEDSYFKDLGNIPRDLAVDSIFPEITTCYDVPLAVGDSVVWGFPIDTFVSYGPRLILVIYAYGAYVDLNKSAFKMVARPLHSAGLIVSCPTILTDGYLGIGAQGFSGRVPVSQMKPLICRMGNVLYVRLTSLQQERDNALSSNVIICTRWERSLTTVTTAPALTAQLAPGAVRSLFVQRNPYTAKTEMNCHIKIVDAGVTKHLHYDLSVKVPVIVGTIPYRVAATSSTSDILHFGKRKQLTGQYSMLHIWTLSLHNINIEVNASLQCAKAIRHHVNGESENEFHLHLQEAADAPYCQNYLIPLWNNDNDSSSSNNKDNNSHLVYFPKAPYLKAVDSFIDNEGKVGKLTALFLNQNIAKFLFIAKIHLNDNCPQHCKHISVQIVYRALVSHNIVSLQWHLLLNSSGFQVTLSDIPISGVLLYITLLNDTCIENVCSANIDIQHDDKEDHALSIWNGSASDQTPFVEYRLLWSDREYTWNEAEEICQELGGMHLASISSEKEYLLITRMLLGGAYHVFDADKLCLPILTPCLMGSPLCVIHIGLKRQVS